MYKKSQFEGISALAPNQRRHLQLPGSRENTVGGTPEDWWLGISPEGFGTVAMAVNLIIAIVVPD